MKRILTAIIIASGSVPTRAQGVPWTILNNGSTVHYTAAGEPFFDFPTGPPGVNYFTRAVSGIAEKGGLAATFAINANGTPFFDWRTNPNNTCAGSPANVRLFIQRSGDNMTGQGVMQQYRYWSRAGYAMLAPGKITIKADFDPARWSDVFGALGSAYPDRFAAAIKDAARVGVTFGGGCFYGHGVFVSGAGTAQFIMNAFAPY